ncbi:MAG TPA: hypothetical protein VIW74_04105 [Pyrinomonadaceae bacterium]|jgi:hypothetical protein
MLTITNRTRQLLIVPKNSGSSVYLGPGEGAKMPRTEIDGNTKIEKLVRTGAVSVGEAAPQSMPEAAVNPEPEEEAPRSKKSKPQK